MNSEPDIERQCDCVSELSAPQSVRFRTTSFLLHNVVVSRYYDIKHYRSKWCYIHIDLNGVTTV